MRALDTRELFLDIFEAAKEYVPDSDHLEMCTKLLMTLSEQGFNIRDLHGDDDVIDEALEEMLEEDHEYNEEEYE